MTKFNKTDLISKKEEYLRLQAEYFDAMVEYDFYKATEISKQIANLIPTTLLVEFSTDVATQLRCDRNFMKKIENEYNEESRKELLDFMFGPQKNEE